MQQHLYIYSTLAVSPPSSPRIRQQSRWRPLSRSPQLQHPLPSYVSYFTSTSSFSCIVTSTSIQILIIFTRIVVLRLRQWYLSCCLSLCPLPLQLLNSCRPCISSCILRNRHSLSSFHDPYPATLLQVYASTTPPNFTKRKTPHPLGTSLYVVTFVISFLRSMPCENRRLAMLLS